LMSGVLPIVAMKPSRMFMGRCCRVAKRAD
jgi:hypothetical protein